MLLAAVLVVLPGAGRLVAATATRTAPSPYTAKDLSFSAKKQAVVWLSGKTTATIYREYHAPPDKWRIEYLAPPSAKGRIMIQKGSTIWQWEPAEGKVFVTSGDVPAQKLDGLQPILADNYETEVLSDRKSEAGRPVRLLQLTPLHSGKSKWLISLDRDTGIILRRERTTSKGDYELISQCLEFKPGPVDPSLFDPKHLPSGKVVKRTWSGKRVSLTELKRLIGVSLPSKLSGGFRVNSTSVVRSSPVTAQLTYTDGLASISLFASTTKTDASPGEQVHQKEFQAKTTTFGHLTSVSWQADEFSYTLVGDVSQRVLLDIAKSLSP